MNTYGCVKCQVHHVERENPELYKAHLGFQSKHGIKHLSERDWAFSKSPFRPRREASR